MAIGKIIYLKNGDKLHEFLIKSTFPLTINKRKDKHDLKK
jgi:hypothetical protein